jgi:hypothetical protein
MSKRTAFIFIPILSLGVILAGCNFPFLSSGGGGAAPTPDLTLTALFLPLVPTATPPVLPTVAPTEVPSATPVPPTETPVPPTLTPTVAATLPSRPGPLSYAWLLSTKPKLDGNWGDWVGNATQYGMDYIVYGKGNWEGTNDLSASYALGWDYNNFYIGVKVHDDKYVQNASGSEMYQGDGVELQLDTNLYGDFYTNSMNVDDYQMGFSPGLGSIGGPTEATLYMPRSIGGTKTQVVVASTAEDGLYRVEIAIPWGIFSLTHPYLGMYSGFTICVNDNDDPSVNAQQTMMCSDPYRKLLDPTTWGEVWFVR